MPKIPSLASRRLACHQHALQNNPNKSQTLKPERPNPACRQKRQGRKRTTLDATKAEVRPKRQPKSASNPKGGREAPPDKS
ncbi:MAG: hypothetical protein Q8N96_13890 [Methylovulum sp.]|nr:hypothetical protein [Methylovulum sp.]